jgi:hypothetical protein
VKFSKIVGFSYETIVSWEDGSNKLPLKSADRIMVATGASAGDLFDGQGKLEVCDLLKAMLRQSGHADNRTSWTFEKADYDKWKELYKPGQDADASMFQSLRANFVLCLAAAKRADRHRQSVICAAVCHELEVTINRLIKFFKLDDYIR